MSGWKDWQEGEVVYEDDFQSFVQNQVVQVYADSVARGSALGTAVAEGMVSYLRDTNEVEVYDGSSWVNFTGDITQVVAGTALTGGGSEGSVTLNVDESAITLAQSQVTDLVSDLADKADNADFTGGTAGYTALSNGTAGLSYQPVSHNYIINGAFDIWQRGDTATVGVNQTEFTADRWRVVAENGAAATVIKQTEIEVPGLGIMDTIKIDFTASASASGTNLVYRFSPEEINKDFAGKTMKLSFYARANRSLTTTTAAFFFPSGTVSENKNYSFTTSWQRFEETITFPADVVATGNGWLQVVRDNSGGVQSGDWWEITGVQLEAGSIATPFKRNANSIQGELAACQRYYIRDNADNPFTVFTNVAAVTETLIRGSYRFPTTMRATPTMNAEGDFQADGLETGPFDLAFSRGNKNGYEISTTTTNATRGHAAPLRAFNDASAYIEMNAEL